MEERGFVVKVALAQVEMWETGLYIEQRGRCFCASVWNFSTSFFTKNKSVLFQLLRNKNLGFSLNQSSTKFFILILPRWPGCPEEKPLHSKLVFKIISLHRQKAKAKSPLKLLLNIRLLYKFIQVSVMPLVFSAVGQSKLFAQMYFNSSASGVLASVASSIWSAHKKWHQTKATSQFRKNYQGKKKIFNLFFFVFLKMFVYGNLINSEKPEKNQRNINTWVFPDMCQDSPRNRTRVYVQYGRLSSQTFEESSENPFHRVVWIRICTQIWCGLMQPWLDKRIWNGGRGRKKKVQRRMPSPPALPSLLREQNISFFPPSLSSSALLSTLSCLDGWCRRGEPECERGPQRADEDRVRVCVCPHVWMCASAVYRKKSWCVSPSLECVFGVGVDSP